MLLQEFIDRCAAQLRSDNPNAVRARQYLEQERGLRPETIQGAALGYCDWDQAGPDGEPNYKLFQGKFVVPIRAEFGEPVAIAARSPNKAEKGWYNSSADTGFTKGDHFFLLDKARRSIFEANKAYLFEGYMDGIVVRQEGLPNAVALMGTALGLRHIGLLRRYCEEVCLCFDTDPNYAGQAAEAKSVLRLASAGYKRLSRIHLPSGVDPDEYIVANGPQALVALEKPVTDDDIEAYQDFLKWYKQQMGNR